MPITPFLNGERLREYARPRRCIRNGLHRSADRGLRRGVKQAIATKLIALAKAGERNPDILCEETLKDIHRPQQWASEAAQSSALRDST
jgi:hypothetical protein